MGLTADEDGLSIVELIIAVTVVMIVFAGLAATLIASFGSLRSGEARVAATALANEAIEEMSTIPWRALGLLEQDPALPDFDEVDGDGIPVNDATFEGEDLVLLPGDPEAVTNIVPPHVESDIERNGRSYAITRWVTFFEEDGGPDLKRMVVTVTWLEGTVERRMRMEGLRSPNPDDMDDLLVEFHAADPEQVWLRSPGENYRNRGAISFDVIVGELSAVVVLTFEDRFGATRTITTSTTEEGAVVTRTFIVPNNSFSFPHGAHSFRVTATAGDGSVSSHTTSINFYQELAVPSLVVNQGGSPTSELAVCRTSEDEILISDPIDVVVEVAGMTPAEAGLEAEEGTPSLGLTWAAGPQGGVVGSLNSPEPHLVPDTWSRTVEGGSFAFSDISTTEGAGDDLVTTIIEALDGTEDAELTLRIRADLLAEGGFADSVDADVLLPIVDTCA